MKKIILLLTAHVLFLLAGSVSAPQHQQLQYAITNGGKTVGYLRLLCQEKGALQFISMHGQVAITTLLTIQVNAKEEALFEEGVLQWSTTRREVNGKEKADKSTRLVDPGYELQSGTDKKKLDSARIKSTIMSMYLNEPADGDYVYSDNHQCFLKVEATATHQYKITMPEGGYNLYTFENGVCTRVDVHHTLYRLSFILI